MKLILRQYLESLREREELDAILPDLLSELGFNVLSRPGRGTTQSGVDVAAVGKDEDGERKVFLLAIKRGDLTRQSWDGSPQALRPTLNEIRDVYIPSKLPRRYRSLKIVICVCLGGVIQEQVRSQVTGYTEENTTSHISYVEWNGDAIAEMLLHGLLSEQLLPIDLRSSFRKAVAMVDEPDVAYRHFRDLTGELSARARTRDRERVRAARQLYICLWVLFVWARDASNVEGPYRASELALLTTWEILRPLLGKGNKSAKALAAVFGRLLMLHLAIAAELFDRKILPHASKRYAISMAVQSREAADINLKLFELLGRIAATGLWYDWLSRQGGADSESEAAAARLFNAGTEIIANNPCLLLPLCDHQAIDVGLFLLLTAAVDGDRRFLEGWLSEMAGRLVFAVRSHGRYPTAFDSYREVVAHPREQTDEYRKEATSGSILVPLLACWLAALGRDEEYEALAELKRNELSHCTLQAWLPEEGSEDAIYCDTSTHGVSLELQLTSSPNDVLDTLAEACEKESGFASLSAIRAGYWPIVLLACRHYRLPVPPQFWLNFVRPPQGARSDET